MTREHGRAERNREVLSPGELTDRLQSVETGDELVVNDRETVLEVTSTDRYSVEAVDDRGNEYTLSQNLQTGGWAVHEEVRWVSSVGALDDPGA